jgi:hypothetical protein
MNRDNTYRISNHDINPTKLLNRLFNTPLALGCLGHILQEIAVVSTIILSHRSDKVSTRKQNTALRQGRGQESYSLNKHSFHPKSLTLLLHLLRRLEPVEVVDGYIAALLSEGGRDEGAEATIPVVLAALGDEGCVEWVGDLRGATRDEHVAAFEVVRHCGLGLAMYAMD